MVKKRNIWVSPRQDGRWQVKREGADRASRVVDRKSDAENIARDIGKRDKVEVITQGRDGKIQSKDSFGQDPFPPRDTEH
jgi:U3 small nucleolar ribonucleoprotein component